MKAKRETESMIKVIGTDKRTAEQIELALEQRLLDEVMQELGAFLSKETKPAKRRKTRKGDAR
jgi:hypothetical protein